MPQFTVNAGRVDPYKNFKFRVKWDGREVAGVSQVSGLRRTTQAVSYRTGGDPSAVRKSPGRTNYEPITLSRGLTHDLEFERWANKVFLFGGGAGMESSLADFRKDILIELYNEAGQLVIVFKVYRCWPSEYTAVGELDADDDSFAFESLTLECEGWERDHSVSEPKEPSFVEPA